jgi:riboflavin kinase / FMN adenylyltransferase
VQRWLGVDQAPSNWGRCVVTIGVFDGVHRGHQQIIGRAVASAARSGVPAVVLTFDPHPSEVVRPGSHPAMLTSPAEKSRLIEKLGVAVLVVQPFTWEFSQVEPESFAYTVLVQHLHAGAVVVGENFRFGRRAAGDLGTLAELGGRFGFATEGVPLIRSGDTVYSSTYVRACVAAGDAAAAAEALGREHRISGVVVRGDRRGRDLGYPTANLQTAQYVAVPADGVYAGWLVLGPGRLPAAISIGTNPTFDGRGRRVEAYALDTDDLDLYGEQVAFDFVARIRDTERFASVESLLAAMASDVASVRTVLG